MTAAPCSLVAALSLLLVACGEPAAPALQRPAGGRHAVQQAAQQLAGAALPHQRVAALRRLRGCLAELAPAILEGLADPQRGDYLACISLAAELRMTAALTPLLQAVMDASSPWRAAALDAANRIRPLPTEQLQPLLQEADEGLRLTALRALAGRRDAAFELLLPLLASTDVETAVAAAAALPPIATKERIDALLQLSFASQLHGAEMVRALGRQRLPTAVLDHWLRQLDDMELEPKLAVLEVVCNQHQKVDAEPLLQLVAADATVVGFEAMRCLVASRLVDAAWLLARCDNLPRQHRLVCALGLLQMQRPEGGRTLYELAFGDAAAANLAAEGTGAEPPAAPAGETAAIEPTDPTCILARQLMSRIADLPLHGDPAVFAAWSERPRIAHREALDFTGPARALFPAASEGGGRD